MFRLSFFLLLALWLVCAGSVCLATEDHRIAFQVAVLTAPEAIVLFVFAACGPRLEHWTLGAPS